MLCVWRIDCFFVRDALVCDFVCVQRRNPISKSGVAALNEALQSNTHMRVLHVTDSVIVSRFGVSFADTFFEFHAAPDELDLSRKVRCLMRIHVWFCYDACHVDMP